MKYQSQLAFKEYKKDKVQEQNFNFFFVNWHPKVQKQIVIINITAEIRFNLCGCEADIVPLSPFLSTLTR